MLLRQGATFMNFRKFIKEAILQQNKDYIELYKLNSLTVRPNVGGSNCPTKPLNKVINIISKPFLIHNRSYSKDGLGLFKKMLSWR